MFDRFSQPLIGQSLLGGKSPLTEEEKRKQNILNYQTRIAETGYPVPEYEKDKGSTMGSGVLKILDYLDRPRNAIVSGLQQAGYNMAAPADKQRGVGTAMMAGFKGEERTYGSDILANMGVQNKAGRLVGGLLLDAAVDPLMYVTPGAGGLAKGFLKGSPGTLTKETLQTVGKFQSNAVRDAAKKAFLKKQGATTLTEAAKKANITTKAANELISEAAYGKHWADAARTLGGQGSDAIYEAAKRSYAKEAAATYAKDHALGQGKGLGIRTPFGSKEFVSNLKMQDYGASAAAKIGETVPVAGRLGGAVRDSAKKVFSTSYIPGQTPQMEAFYKQIVTKAKGTRAAKDVAARETVLSIDRLSKNLNINGQPFDQAIDAILTGNKAGVTPAQLDMIITQGATPSETKKLVDAARHLADKQISKSGGHIVNPEKMTLGELINVYAREYANIAFEEVPEGLLKKSALTKGGWTNDVANVIRQGGKPDFYSPRIRNVKDGLNIRGGYTGGMSVSNWFNKARKDAYSGLTISEINDILNQNVIDAGGKIPQDFRFLEESGKTALASRRLSSNKMLADKEMVDGVLNAFAEPIPLGDGMKHTIDMYRSQGYSIVTPSSSYNIFQVDPATVKSLGTEIADTLGSQASSSVAASQRRTFQILSELASDDAMNLLATTKGQARVYAIPSGILQKVNQEAGRQIDDGIGALNKLMGKFYRAWKPAVTGMRPAYHARNFMSSSFQNFLDVGTDMFAADTQRAAFAASLIGEGGGANTRKLVSQLSGITADIGGKQMTVKELRKLMVENGVLNTFMSSDTSSLAESILREAATEPGALKKALLAWPKAGKIVGNTSEEYFRATNFIANMKKGMSPQRAAEMANKFHFNYQDITNAEKMFKQVLPFYTWARKNIPLQLEQFLNSPAAYQNVRRAGLSGASIEGIDYDSLPEYLREAWAVPFGTSEEGRTRVVDFGLPMGELQTDLHDVAKGLNPVLKFLVERGTGQSIMTKGPIRSFKGEESTRLINWIANFYGGDASQVPEGLTDFLLGDLGMEVAEAANYLKNNFGTFRDITNFEHLAGPAPDTQVVVQGKNYNRFNDPVLGTVSRVLDPNFTKYYSKKAGQSREDYAYIRQMSTLIKQLEEMGYDPETIAEIRKKQQQGIDFTKYF